MGIKPSVPDCAGSFALWELKRRQGLLNNQRKTRQKREDRCAPLVLSGKEPGEQRRNRMKHGAQQHPR